MSTHKRTARSHRTTTRAVAPDLYGRRDLHALTGLAHPAPLTSAELAVVPTECLIPPTEVARTHEGVTRVLTGLGHADLLTCEVVTVLRDAARRGWGLSVPAHAAKALWRFCDAFADWEPLLLGARDGLRVHAAA